MKKKLKYKLINQFEIKPDSFYCYVNIIARPRCNFDTGLIYWDCNKRKFGIDFNLKQLNDFKGQFDSVYELIKEYSNEIDFYKEENPLTQFPRTKNIKKNESGNKNI